MGRFIIRLVGLKALVGGLACLLYSQAVQSSGLATVGLLMIIAGAACLACA
jgi:hypothetical protein